jgi:transposase
MVEVLAKGLDHEHYPDQCNARAIRNVHPASADHRQTGASKQNPAVQDIQPGALSSAYRLPVVTTSRAERGRKKEISWQAVYYHFRKWSCDGSLQRVFERSLDAIRNQIDTKHINLDGSHTQAKKGGEAVAYQGRKKAKTSNILPMTDAKGFILATTGIVAGNHNDAFELKDNLRAAFKFMKRQGIPLTGSFFNADAAFDTKAARWTCFNHKLIPNIVENARSRKRPKRGRKRYFNPDIYKQRFSAERTFAWIDKFRALLIRFDRKALHFLGAHFIVYALINFRHLLDPKP